MSIHIYSKLLNKKYNGIDLFKYPKSKIYRNFSKNKRKKFLQQFNIIFKLQQEINNRPFLYNIFSSNLCDLNIIYNDENMILNLKYNNNNNNTLQINRSISNIDILKYHNDDIEILMFVLFKCINELLYYKNEK